MQGALHNLGKELALNCFFTQAGFKTRISPHNTPCFCEQGNTSRKHIQQFGLYFQNLHSLGATVQTLTEQTGVQHGLGFVPIAALQGRNAQLTQNFAMMTQRQRCPKINRLISDPGYEG